MSNDLTALLAQGHADMDAVAGETLRFARGRIVKSRVRGVLTPDALTWSPELGGPQMAQTAHLDVAVRALGDYVPAVGDLVQAQDGTLYTINDVTRAPYDPTYHLSLAKK